MREGAAIAPEGSFKAPRVSFWTLGCRMNQYDTAALRKRLLAAGLSESQPGDRDAELIVVNTCTVTRRADQEARQLIRKLHRDSPGSRIIVTGCYAQRAPDELRSLPGVTAVLGAAEREDSDVLLSAPSRARETAPASTATPTARRREARSCGSAPGGPSVRSARTLRSTSDDRAPSSRSRTAATPSAPTAWFPT